MLWLKDAEIIQLNKKLAEKFLAMSEKYCWLEEELLSWEADELKTVLDFYFSFFIFLKGELYNELDFEGNRIFFSGTVAESLKATVSVKA